MERKFATAAMVVFVLSAAVYLFKCNFVVVGYQHLKTDPVRWSILTKKQFKAKCCMGNMVTMMSALEDHFWEDPEEYMRAVRDIMVLTDYWPGKRMPVCPEGGVYTVKGDDTAGYYVQCSVHGSNPVCSKIKPQASSVGK